MLYIPSIIYKSDIAVLCNQLNKIGDIKYFVLYILFSDGNQFVLSSTPSDFLSLYWNEKFNQYDYSANLQSFNNQDHYLCNDNPSAEPLLKELLEEKFNIYRTFYITRKTPECRFVFGALHDHHIHNPLELYRSTISTFEDFCIDFLDKTIEIIKQHHPNYSHSIVLNDRYYRKSIIKNSHPHKPILTNREIECLYWAAQGKSSEETAAILKIKATTVDEYRKQIKNKLNCSNLAHAVYEAIKYGYLGAFNQIQIL